MPVGTADQGGDAQESRSVTLFSNFSLQRLAFSLVFDAGSLLRLLSPFAVELPVPDSTFCILQAPLRLAPSRPKAAGIKSLAILCNGR